MYVNDVTGEEMPVGGLCFFFFPLILSCLSQTVVKQSGQVRPCSKPPPVYQDLSMCYDWPFE